MDIIHPMSNNQIKKSAAKKFNEARQKAIDDAPRIAREREAYKSTPERKAARRQLIAACALRIAKL